MRLILPHFGGVNYRSTGDFSVNNHWSPTLPISQTKVIFVRNILELLNNTSVTAVLKIWALEVGSLVPKYP